MSHPETIKIDEIEYVRKDAQSVPTGPVKIVILQRGWVMVGIFSQINSQCRLDNAAVIRKWGTTKGLGEIANSGPTKDTVLDKTPPVEFHELTVIATIQCRAEKWNL
jgi:hypothetical protein